MNEPDDTCARIAISILLVLGCCPRLIAKLDESRWAWPKEPLRVHHDFSYVPGIEA